MQKTSSYLISLFIIIFWVFRVIVAISTQYGNDFGGFIALDLNIEIALLFVTVLSVGLIVKRKIIGAMLYVISYSYYFGGYIYKNALPIIINRSAFEGIVIQNTIISIIAILLSIFALLDLFIEKVRKNKYTDSKTDWFFDNKKTDRNIDDRADKNQYKLY